MDTKQYEVIDKNGNAKTLSASEDATHVGIIPYTISENGDVMFFLSSPGSERDRAEETGLPVRLGTSRGTIEPTDNRKDLLERFILEVMEENNLEQNAIGATIVTTSTHQIQSMRTPGKMASMPFALVQITNPDANNLEQKPGESPRIGTWVSADEILSAVPVEGRLTANVPGRSDIAIATPYLSPLVEAIGTLDYMQAVDSGVGVSDLKAATPSQSAAAIPE